MRPLARYEKMDAVVTSIHLRAPESVAALRSSLSPAMTCLYRSAVKFTKLVNLTGDFTAKCRRGSEQRGPQEFLL